MPNAGRHGEDTPAMRPYLDSIHARLASEAPIQLVHELEQAFSEAIGADPAWATPRRRELHDLLRFCRFDAIAPWLANERDAVVRALAFAERIGDAPVAKILREALAGRTQGDARYSVTLPDGNVQTLEVDAGAVTRHAGQQWGGTDLALSLAMDHFTEAVVRELVAAAHEFERQPPLAERRKASARQAAATRAQHGTAACLFEALVGACAPRLEVGDWDAFEARRVGGNTVIAVSHEANPPAPAALLRAMADRHGEAARELLAMHARHDGAALFQHRDTCGFCLASIEEWDALRERAIDWAENVTWQGEHDEIPPMLYDAIAFGFIPGDSEVWLLITSGEHAGKVMLSDTDLIGDSPRFESIGEFVATLLDDAARIINCGGYVRYEVEGEERFAVRYLGDDA